jgi:hypothetical protein
LPKAERKKEKRIQPLGFYAKNRGDAKIDRNGHKMETDSKNGNPLLFLRIPGP